MTCCFCRNLAWTAKGAYIELGFSRGFGRARQRFGAHTNCFSSALGAELLSSGETPRRICPVCGADAGTLDNLLIRVSRLPEPAEFSIHDTCLQARLATGFNVEI